MRSRAASSLVVGILAIGTAAPGGCDRQDPAADAIESVSRQLQALNTDQGIPAPAPTRRATYEAAVRDLRPHVDAEEPHRQAAARRLLASIHAARAQLAMDEVATLQEEALAQMTHVRSIYETYRTSHALAEASLVYSPAEDLAELRSELSDREDLLQATRSERAAVAARIEGLEQQRRGRLADAEELRAEEQEVRREMSDASGQDRLTLVRKATTVQRQADAKEVEAATLQALIEKEKPTLSAIEDEIRRLEKQRELLQAAINRVQERAADNEATAARNREKAAKTADDLHLVMEQLIATMTNPLEEAFASVLETQGEAIRAARPMGRLSSVDRTEAAVKMARLHQRMGDIQRSRAIDWELLSGLSEQLARATPTLPNASVYADTAAEAQSRRNEALQAAAEAYAEARREYEVVAGRGPIGERVDQLLATLAEIEQAVARQLPESGGESAGG